MWDRLLHLFSDQVVSTFRERYLRFEREFPEIAFALFVENTQVECGAISSELLESLKQLKIVSQVLDTPDRVECSIRFFRFYDLLIATDRLWYSEPSYSEGMVMPIHPENSLLMEIIPDCSGARVLDIGFGSGVLGLAALRRGAKLLVGLEVSQRAERFANFNALINSISLTSCDWRLNPGLEPSDIFNRVNREKFDLILCNPPFEIGRDNNHSSITLANGGADGLVYFRAILPELNRYLSPNGEAHLVFFSIGSSAEPRGIKDIASNIKGDVELSWVENPIRTSDFVKWNTGETREFPSHQSHLWFGRVALRNSSKSRIVCNRLPAMENWHWPIYGSTPIGFNPNR
jgi:release factor glutamine methyltransferase